MSIAIFDLNLNFEKRNFQFEETDPPSNQANDLGNCCFSGLFRIEKSTTTKDRKNRLNLHLYIDLLSYCSAGKSVSLCLSDRIQAQVAAKRFPLEIDCVWRSTWKRLPLSPSLPLAFSEIRLKSRSQTL